MDDTITTGRKTEEDSQPRVLISLRNAIMSSRFPKAYASSDWDKSCWQTRRKQSAFSNSHGKLSSSAIPRSIYKRRGSRVERSINHIDGNAGFFHMHVPRYVLVRTLLQPARSIHWSTSSSVGFSCIRPHHLVRRSHLTTRFGRNCRHWNIRRLSAKRCHANYGLRFNHAVLSHHTLSIRV